MSADLARPIGVRACYQHADRIEFGHGRSAIFAADGTFMGTRSAWKQAALALE